jgi:hypothetical protein
VHGEIYECNVNDVSDERFLVQWTASPFSDLKQKITSEALNLEGCVFDIQVRLTGILLEKPHWKNRPLVDYEVAVWAESRVGGPAARGGALVRTGASVRPA